MNQERAGRCFAVISAILLIAGQAAADPVRDPPGAEKLFETGKELLQTGDWTNACAKFAASMDLDPAVGTLLKIAKCHEHEQKLALALYDYQRALTLNRQMVEQSEARRAELEEFTSNAIKVLEPRVPLLRVIVRERPSGLRVWRNDRELPASALGEPLPVDPGPEH